MPMMPMDPAQMQQLMQLQMQQHMMMMSPMQDPQQVRVRFVLTLRVLLRPSRLFVAQLAAYQKQFVTQVAGGAQLGAEGKKNA